MVEKKKKEKLGEKQNKKKEAARFLAWCALCVTFRNKRTIE